MRCLLACLFLLCAGRIAAQAPPIAWQALIGGSGGFGEWLVPLQDGSVIGIGTVETSEPGVTGYHPGGKVPTDGWICKLSPTGELLWEQAFGGSDTEQPYQAVLTSDGGIVVAGFTGSSDGDVTDPHGSWDMWVVKFSASGQLLWERALGGSNEEFFYLYPQNYANGVHLLETQDQGIALLAHTASTDGDVSGAHSSPLGMAMDIWVVKLDSEGELLWQRCLGGTSEDRANAMVETASGDLAIAGHVGSIDGDVTDHHGMWDVWVACLSTGGELLWQRALGGSEDDQAYDISTTADDGLILCGSTNSNDGDVDDNAGVLDAWVVKLTADGEIDWKRCLGGTQWEYPTQIKGRPDGSNLVLLMSWSTDGDMVGAPPNTHAWVMALDATGEIDWATGYGNGNESSIYYPAFTADGGCAMMFPLAGIGVPPEFGTGAGWVVSMDPAGDVAWQHAYGGSSFEGAHHLVAWPNGRLAFTGINQSTDGDLAGFPPDHYTFWVCALGDTHTGVEDADAQQLIVAPDAAGATLRIAVPELLSSVELRLYDARGGLQRSDRMTGTEATMDLRGLASGAYVLVVRAQEVTHRRRIVVP